MLFKDEPMTHFFSSAQRLLVTSLVLGLLLPAAGCRSGGGWSGIPGMGWVSWNKEKKYDTEGWASFDEAPEVTRPSETAVPTEIPAGDSSSNSALAGTTRGATGRPASYQQGDYDYPQTQYPDPYAGLEQSAAPPRQSYERLARRDESQGMAGARSTDSAGGGSAQQGFYSNPPGPQPGASSAGTSTGPWAQQDSASAAGASPSNFNSPGWNSPPSGGAAGNAPAAFQGPPAGGNSSTVGPGPAAWNSDGASSSDGAGPWSADSTNSATAAPAVAPPWATTEAPSTSESRSQTTTTPPAASEATPWRPGSTSDYVPRGVPTGPPSGGTSSGEPRFQSYRPKSKVMQGLGQHHAADRPMILAVDDAFPQGLYR